MQERKQHIEACTKWLIFAENNFKSIFLNDYICISNKFPLKYVPVGLIDNKLILDVEVAWHQTGAKPLPQPMMTTIHNTTWYQWAKVLSLNLYAAHYSDVIMSMMASQITGVVIVYWMFCSSADQTKHQSSTSLAFVRGIHRWPVNSPHKWPVTRKMFQIDDVIMKSPWPAEFPARGPLMWTALSWKLIMGAGHTKGHKHIQNSYQFGTDYYWIIPHPIFSYHFAWESPTRVHKIITISKLDPQIIILK